jgi:hypothetical protein
MSVSRNVFLNLTSKASVPLMASFCLLAGKAGSFGI